MKLSLSTGELLAQLQTATRVASSRASVQALSGVMISAEVDRAVLLATDFERVMVIQIAAAAFREGA